MDSCYFMFWVRREERRIVKGSIVIKDSIFHDVVHQVIPKLEFKYSLLFNYVQSLDYFVNTSELSGKMCNVLKC